MAVARTMTAKLMRRLYIEPPEKGEWEGRARASYARHGPYTSTQSRFVCNSAIREERDLRQIVAVEIQARGGHVRSCRVVDHDTSNKDGSSGFIQCHGSSGALAGLRGSAKRAAPRFRPIVSEPGHPKNDFIAVGKLTGGNHGIAGKRDGICSICIEAIRILAAPSLAAVRVREATSSMFRYSTSRPLRLTRCPG